jgi:serine/threonine-protein kinase
MTALDMTPLPPGTLIGGDVVEGLLGAGGCGTVYRVRSPEGYRSALKLLPLGKHSERGWREVAISVRLRHPNLVRLLGSGAWPDAEPRFLWLRMELIEGSTLDVWWREHDRDTCELVDKMLELGRALAVAHEAGVVHRDVKEANILVRQSDGQAVLVDFGAGYVEQALTLTKELFPPGTPHYRAPEAWRFAREHKGMPGAHYRAGPGDDLYSQGVVLYRLLTGRFPFLPAEDGYVDVEAVLHRAPLPPRLLNPRVPRAVEAVCLRLLEKMPEARYPSAVALCEALEALKARADESWKVPLRGDAAPAGAKRRARGAQARAVAEVGLGLALVLGGGWLVERWLSGREAASSSPPASPDAAPTRQAPTGQEVAPSDSPPESEAAAVAPPPAAPRKDHAPVKKKKPQQKTSDTQPSGREAAFRNACLGLTGVALQACLSAQQMSAMRPLPPPQECPAGAVETMIGRFGLRLGETKHVMWGNARESSGIAVREDTPALVGGDWEAGSDLGLGGRGTHVVLPDQTRLTGRLFFKDGRVYGRFIKAHTPGGDTYPMCLELLDLDDEVGLAPMPGSGQDNLLVEPTAKVRVVDRFK